MAQKLFQDKITTLSHSGGVITLPAGAILTIGGQQYRTTSALSRTIATDVTMTALARYQVYAVISGGVVDLRISANENSVGPAGFASWCLVGSFHANGLASVAFGAWIRSLTGTPETDSILFTPTVYGGVTNPTRPTTHFEAARLNRRGGGVFYQYNYSQSATTGAAAGSGVYIFGLSSLVPDGTRVTTTATTNSGSACIGSATFRGTAASTEISGFLELYNDGAGKSGITVWGTLEGGGVMTVIQSGSYAYTIEATLLISFSTDWIPIVGWSDTPIKDL